MILVDTNILVFAANVSSPKNKIARQFLKEHAPSLVVAHQNILEFIRVFTNPKFPSPMKPLEAHKAIQTITNDFRIIYPHAETLDLILQYMQQLPLKGDQIFDAYLAATAISSGITTIATDNVRDFSHFGLKILNPFLVP